MDMVLGLNDRNLGMNSNHNPRRASSDRSTDSSTCSKTNSSKDSSKVSGMMCSLGNIDTGKCKDSCSIGTGKDMSMNTVMDMNIRNLVHNPDQQPKKCKAQKGQVLYLV